jgi:hypothetical protein
LQSSPAAASDRPTSGGKANAHRRDARNSGSRVVGMDSSFEDDYLGRYFGLFFDKLIGKDYEKGLAKLKALAEAGP